MISLEEIYICRPPFIDFPQVIINCLIYLISAIIPYPTPATALKNGIRLQQYKPLVATEFSNNCNFERIEFGKQCFAFMLNVTKISSMEMDFAMKVSVSSPGRKE